MNTTSLTVTERKILDIERHWWQYAGAKEQQIREDLGLSTTQFYQQVNRMLDEPRVQAADPILVKRLLRRRGDRDSARVAARVAARDNSARLQH